MSDVRPGGPPDSAERSTRPLVGVPRWVKIFVLVAAAVVLLMVLAMLVTGEQHGPGRHKSAPWITETPAASCLTADVGLGDRC